MSNSFIKTPDELLDELGITKPEQLKIEAIAYHCHAVIVYEPLTGCEANIVGKGDRAIITVNSNAIATRRRFSAGHELGHWMRDRGQIAFGCSQKQIDSEWVTNNPETRANQFASDLLLPSKIFVPLAKGRPITIQTVRDLSRIFQMSLTATAIKLLHHGSFPSMLVYYENGERKWFIPSADLPNKLWPSKQPNKGTVTARLISDPGNEQVAEEIRSDKWFDVRDSDRYYIRESCFRSGPEAVVTILWWEDETQVMKLDDEEERNAARRSDWRRE